MHQSRAAAQRLPALTSQKSTHYTEKRLHISHPHHPCQPLSNRRVSTLRREGGGVELIVSTSTFRVCMHGQNGVRSTPYRSSIHNPHHEEAWSCWSSQRQPSCPIRKTSPHLKVGVRGNVPVRGETVVRRRQRELVQRNIVPASK